MSRTLEQQPAKSQRPASVRNTISLPQFLRATPTLLPDLPLFLPSGLGMITIGPRTKKSLPLIFERWAAKRPERVFLEFCGREYTYGQVNVLTNRWARALQDLGVRQGQPVAIMSTNRPESVFAALATVKLGAIATMVNYNQSGTTLEHSLGLLDYAAALVGPECADNFGSIRDGLLKCPVLSLDHEGETLPGSSASINSLAANQSADNLGISETIPAKSKAFYIFTSGTTGLPKAAAMTHLRWLKSMYGIGGMATRLKASDRIFVCLPLYHNNGLTVAFSNALVSGASMAISRKFSASQFWDEVRASNSTAFVYIGEFCRYLLNQAPHPNDKDHRVRVCVGNGMRAEFWDEFQQRFGVKRISEFYGSSECNLAFANALGLPRTAGMSPLPFSVVAYDVDEERPHRNARGRLRKVKKGEVGLLITKITTRHPWDGYSDQAATDSKVIQGAFSKNDAWFLTGDLVLNQGFYHIAFADRLGDTFRWKGENVATTEVESAIAHLDGVENVVVYGVAIPGTDGKAGMAAIEMQPGHDFDPAGALAHIQGKLPRYAVPLVIRLTAAISTTTTFKGQKVELRKQGFDPNAVGTDKVFVLPPGASEYVPWYPEFAADVAGTGRQATKG